MRVIITCGPSSEPIDRVRRITNASTGELGALLSNRLASGGAEVTCLQGVGATHAQALTTGVERVPFATNDDLLERLRAIPERDSVAGFFHAAALCDFRVKEVRDRSGGLHQGEKLSSGGEITLTLAPATKLIGELRTLFPRALIVGWKYELDGARDEALQKARTQIAVNSTDACVLNGAAYGAGFGLLEAQGAITHFETKAALCDGIAGWLSARRAAPSAFPGR